MRNALFLISLASGFLVTLAGCSNIISDSGPDQTDYPVAWEKSGSYSRIGRSVRLVVRDAETLAQIPLAEVPVDFKTQMVLVAALGPTPSSDLGIRITRIWKDGSRVRVQERQIHPGAEQNSGLDPASPWTLVVVPRTDLNVEGYSVTVPAKLLSNRTNYGGGGNPPSRGIVTPKRIP